ncbi:hypothetical protein DXG01_012835 [Tephrocybe rancida]|nr:hypothetical protein DXG01_012835 [Tephrocybe rancida]
MHRCFKVEEVVRLMFNLVSKADLINLARTYPLIYSLPDDVLVVDRNGPESFYLYTGVGPEEGVMAPYLYLKRGLEPNDYRRVKENASRVRVMKWPQRASLRVELSHLFLAKLFSGQQVLGPIFPSVRELHTHMRDFDDQAIHPRLIVGPHLQRILINFRNFRGFSATSNDAEIPSDLPWDNVKMVLSSPKPALSLQEFSLSVCLERNARHKILTFTSMDVSELVTSFPSMLKLNVLSLRVNYPTFTLLATLPKLTKLAISMFDDEFSSPIARTTPFPCLEHLSLNIPNLASFAKLLSHSGTFPGLSSLEMYGSRTSTTEISSLFRAIKEHTTLSETLEELKIMLVWSPWDPSQCVVPPIDFPTVEPLLSASCLRVLVIKIDGIFTLDNLALAKIGTALPHLQVLSLLERTKSTVTTPGITLMGLVPFFTSCPRLQTLTLRVSALENVSKYSIMGALPRFPNLMDFNCCTSPIKDSHRVATFLALLLPRLTGVSHSWGTSTREAMANTQDDEGRYKMQWQEVNRLLKMESPYKAMEHSLGDD